MFARMFIRYCSKVDFGWNKKGNIGDAIQNIAIENLYKKLGILESSLTLVNRDELNLYEGREVELVMQSYFADAYGVFPFPIAKRIKPLFLGFHLNPTNNTRKRFVKEKIGDSFKAYEPIGCRDRNTARFLQKLGLEAYFSGCMTLTLDKREKAPENGKIFVVDLCDKALKKLPREIKEVADFSISHVWQFENYPLTFDDAMFFENKAKEILEVYKNEAKLVITSRIHVAMPCIAMGIPVVFISKALVNARFDVLQGLVPVYYYKDIKYVDWMPKAVNIDDMKNAIIRNAKAQILNTDDKVEALAELDRVLAKLKPIEYLPKWRLFIRKIAVMIKEWLE